MDDLKYGEYGAVMLGDSDGVVLSAPQSCIKVGVVGY